MLLTKSYLCGIIVLEGWKRFMEEKLQAQVNKLKKLRQYRNASEAQLVELVKDRERREAVEARYDFVLEGLWNNETEKKISRDILNRYIADTHIEGNKQLFALKDLVMIELEKWRARNVINQKHQDKVGEVPSYQLDALHKLIEKGHQIVERLFGNEKEDDLSVLNKLFKQFRLWLSENQGSRHFICPHCSKMALAKIRTDKYDIAAHPFFKDRILTNEFLMEKYLEGKPVTIDAKFISKVLDCSPMYADWILEHHFNKNHPLYNRYLDKKNAKSS